MARRSGEHGYGWITKVLHWLTVLLVAGQFVVGYSMDLDRGCRPAGDESSGGDTSDAFEERLDRLEDACEAGADRLDLTTGALDLPELHLLLGVSILVIAVVRPLWRRYDG